MKDFKLYYHFKVLSTTELECKILCSDLSFVKQIIKQKITYIKEKKERKPSIIENKNIEPPISK